MNILHALILSVVEGITEFLPISSTGHMILTGTLLNIQETEFVKSFEIIIQFGAILAVLLLYWKKLVLNKKILFNVGIAFIPTAFVGLVLYTFIKNVLLDNPWVVVWSLGFGGIALIILEVIRKNTTETAGLEHLTWRHALVIGCWQSLSVIPGLSRAAATIAGGLVLGLSREAATEFSFLLAIPTMAAATGLDLIKSGKYFSQDQYVLLGVGLTVSFITALIVVRWFIGYVKHHSFISFAVYRIVLAIILLVFVLR